MSATFPRRAIRRRSSLAVAAAVALTALVLLATFAGATSVLERSPAALFDAADRVVYGVVEGVEVGEEDRLTVTLRIERELGQGPAGDDDADPTPIVRVPYGRLASGALVADLPRPEPGDRVLWALAGDADGVSPVTGMWQGAWTVEAEGLVDLRGRVLGVEAGVVRLGGTERETDAVLDAIEDALAGGEARISDELPSGGPGAAAQAAPLPPAPAEDGAEAEVDGTTPLAPYELVLAVPDTTDVRSAVREAARLWTEAGFPLSVRFDDDAPDRVRLGNDSELGADVVILLRRVDGGEGVDLLVRPGSAGRRGDAWAQALGRLLGLPPSPQGFASGLLPSDGRRTPSAGDADALARRIEARRGDLDGDGDVDLYDLAALAEAFGREGIALPADLDGSGRVDAGDLDLLRSGYEFLPASREPPPAAR